MDEVLPALTSEMARDELRAYFLSDPKRTIGEVKHRLREGPEARRLDLLARILREPRTDEVWHFTTPNEIARVWDRLAGRLGRRRAHRQFLLDGWSRLDFLP
ncbi:MAG: hypothetical protein JXB32_00620 [Deltaproteobacteria bacterium]|nr:hypothetical protein [Deltaproteobacteria bacterium]